jgi:outer membrane protein assembly factor BamB
LTVIAAVNDMNRGNSRVLEVDRRGLIRWQFEVNYPVDVRVLGGKRVLISEHGGFRITERDFSGNVLWQKNDLPAKPYNVQRLANGNTFVAMANNLMEFDSTGNTVFNHQTVEELLAACKLPDGQIFYLTRFDRKCIRLDAAGKVVKSFTSNQDINSACVLDITTRGNPLVTLASQGAVEEFDREGKSLWKVMGPGPGMGTAVRNGHVIVASYSSGQVRELDRTGNTVWQYQAAAGYNPFLARQR